MRTQAAATAAAAAARWPVRCFKGGSRVAGCWLMRHIVPARSAAAARHSRQPQLPACTAHAPALPALSSSYTCRNIVLRLLPNRPTRVADAAKQGAIISSSLDSAMELLSGPEYEGRLETVFVIGGGQVRSGWAAWMSLCAACCIG